MSTGTPRARRHTGKAARRNQASAAVRVTPSRADYTGATRSRDTRITLHPLRAGRTVLSSLRSSNPRIRAGAKAAAVALGVIPAPPAKHGWRRPKPVYPVRRPFATGTRHHRVLED